MKTLKCSTCGKHVQVEDAYQFKTCPNCLTKIRAKRIIKKEIRRLDREAQKQQKELGLKKEKLNPIYRTYSTYVQNYEKYFHRKPSFEQYLNAIREEKLRIAREEAQEQAKDMLKQKREEKRFLTDLFPLKSEDCVRFRQIMIRPKSDPDNGFFANKHATECECCARWRIFDREHASEENGDGFADSDFKPIGANPHESEVEESESDKAKKALAEIDDKRTEDFKRTSTDSFSEEREVDRKEFEDNNQDYRKAKQK
jgi:DNA-directed RNA polymerase subunit RPC12/RpoP